MLELLSYLSALDHRIKSLDFLLTESSCQTGSASGSRMRVLRPSGRGGGGRSPQRSRVDENK